MLFQGWRQHQPWGNKYLGIDHWAHCKEGQLLDRGRTVSCMNERKTKDDLIDVSTEQWEKWQIRKLDDEDHYTFRQKKSLILFHPSNEWLDWSSEQCCWLTQVALKSITTAFPSAEAFIKISCTWSKVVGSITSPPRMERVVSRIELVDDPCWAALVQAKRFSAQELFSGKILFPDATLEMEASVTANNESFMFAERKSIGCCELSTLKPIAFYYVVDWWWLDVALVS